VLSWIAVVAGAASTPRAPSTVMWDGDLLAQTKQGLSDPASPLQPALGHLRDWADHWANESDYNKTFTVMSKPEPGPSGNLHDFFSLATYWWPNPNTKDGIPYIRKDGIVNPETFLYDSVPLSQMLFAVSNLSLAHYFTNEPRYCDAAVNFIDAWFFNEETMMNPKSGLQYAQLTRGIDKGRGIGIIDAKDLAFAPDSALLLQASGTCKSWTSDKQGKLAVWLQEYVGWLGTSPHASDEFSQTNNHGTWFDIQALSLSLYAGNVTRSRFLASNALQRVAVQIEPDGRMPMELSRTRSMHYTWWNMMAFFELAQAITHVQGATDLFGYVTPHGQSLQQALDWVAPYTLKNTTLQWPYEEETPFDHGKFFQIYRVASLKYANSSNYESMIPQLPGNVNYIDNTINLVWPKKLAETVSSVSQSTLLL